MPVINSFSTSFIPRACTVPAVRPKKDFTFKTIIVNPSSIIAALNAVGSSMPGRAPSSKGPTGGPRRWSSSCAVLLRGCPPPSWLGNSHVAEGISWILRHQIPSQAQSNLDRKPLEDDHVEADEMYQNAGEKGVSTRGPGGSVPASGQQDQGARDDGKRPSSRGRDRRPRVWDGAAGGRGAFGSGDLGSLCR